MLTERFDIETIGPAGVELARYRLPGGERSLVARRGPKGIEVSDRPAHGEGRSYPVDRGFRRLEQLSAFVADYLRQARLLGAPPMSGEAIGVVLERTEVDTAGSLLGEEAER